MKNTALLLTQYEKYGSVGIEEYKQLLIDEELLPDLDESYISSYNEYLIENGFEPYENDLEMMIFGQDPMEVIRMTYYGDFNLCEDLYQFNGDGNIDSFSYGQVVNYMKKDRDFLKWYIEENFENFDLDSEEVKNTIDEANKLISIGY